MSRTAIVATSLTLIGIGASVWGYTDPMLGIVLVAAGLALLLWSVLPRRWFRTRSFGRVVTRIRRLWSAISYVPREADPVGGPRQPPDWKGLEAQFRALVGREQLRIDYVIHHPKKAAWERTENVQVAAGAESDKEKLKALCILGGISLVEDGFTRRHGDLRGTRDSFTLWAKAIRYFGKRNVDYESTQGPEGSAHTVEVVKIRDAAAVSSRLCLRLLEVRSKDDY